MAKRETNQGARDNANQFGAVYGNVEVNQQPKGGLGLSTGCIAASALVLVVSAIILVMALSLGISSLQRMSGQLQNPTAQPVNTPLRSIAQASPTIPAVQPTNPPVPQLTPSQVILAKTSGGVEGQWVLLFDSPEWGNSYYTLNLSRDGNTLSGASRETRADNPRCFQDFYLSGGVVDENNGIHISLKEAYKQNQCQVDGQATYSKDLDLTYSNVGGVETLKGTVQVQFSDYWTNVQFVRPHP